MGAGRAVLCCALARWQGVAGSSGEQSNLLSPCAPASLPGRIACACGSAMPPARLRRLCRRRAAQKAWAWVVLPSSAAGQPALCNHLYLCHPLQVQRFLGEILGSDSEVAASLCAAVGDRLGSGIMSPALLCRPDSPCLLPILNRCACLSWCRCPAHPLPCPPRCPARHREVCRRAGVPTAEFAVRSDTPCGSTIGGWVQLHAGSRLPHLLSFSLARGCPRGCLT